MRKCFALFLALFLCFSTTVSAAPTSNWLMHSNGYSYSLGGGTSEYVIPYTGYYDISLAGSQGSAYNSNSGGKGYVLSKKVYLNKGDVIKAVVGERPSWFTDGSTLTVPGGNYSELYLNGVLQWRAGGGASEQSNNIAPTGITSVQYLSGNPTAKPAVTLTPHWHSGNGKSGTTHANQFPTVYSETLVGGCYGWSGHTHDATRTCARFHNCDLDPKRVAWCCMNENINGNYIHKPGCPCEGTCWTRAEDKYFRDNWVIDCNGAMNDYACGYPNNTQVLKCGYSQGQILNVNNASYQPHINSGNFNGKSLSNTGNGKCTIRLAEQQELNYSNVVVTTPHYKDGLCELILRDDTVVYYKRK